MSPIRLTESDTTASSRIFIKILFQEIAEFLGLQKLNERSFLRFGSCIFPDFLFSDLRMNFWLLILWVCFRKIIPRTLALPSTFGLRLV